MSDFDQSIQPAIEALRQAASRARTAAELEQLVIEHSRAFSKAAFESLNRDVQARTSPPGDDPAMPDL